MTDLELIARIRHSDTTAFNSFYQRHHAALWRFLYHLEHNEFEARDLFQEVWLRVTKLLTTATPIQNPRALLFQIAANCRRDHLRRKRVRRLFFLPEKNTSEEFASEESFRASPTSIDGFELRERTMQALQHLPEAQRQVFLLKEWEGFSLREIAAQLEVPEGTVKSRLHHAVKNLQKALQELRE